MPDSHGSPERSCRPRAGRGGVRAAGCDARTDVLVTGGRAEDAGGSGLYSVRSAVWQIPALLWSESVHWSRGRSRSPEARWSSLLSACGSAWTRGSPCRPHPRRPQFPDALSSSCPPQRTAMGLAMCSPRWTSGRPRALRERVHRSARSGRLGSTGAEFALSGRVSSARSVGAPSSVHRPAGAAEWRNRVGAESGVSVLSSVWPHAPGLGLVLRSPCLSSGRPVLQKSAGRALGRLRRARPHQRRARGFRQVGGTPVGQRAVVASPASEGSGVAQPRGGCARTCRCLQRGGRTPAGLGGERGVMSPPLASENTG